MGVHWLSPAVFWLGGGSLSPTPKRAAWCEAAGRGPVRPWADKWRATFSEDQTPAAADYLLVKKSWLSPAYMARRLLLCPDPAA